jgi:zinc/manganese transport system permease protein
LPSGPAIILSAGVIYLFSILAGARGALAARVRRTSHRTT